MCCSRRTDGGFLNIQSVSEGDCPSILVIRHFLIYKKGLFAKRYDAMQVKKAKNDVTINENSEGLRGAYA